MINNNIIIRDNKQYWIVWQTALDGKRWARIVTTNSFGDKVICYKFHTNKAAKQYLQTVKYISI